MPPTIECEMAECEKTAQSRTPSMDDLIIRSGSGATFGVEGDTWLHVMNIV